MKEKNVSNLKKTLAVVSLLAPVTAQPLGIGDIELHSVLNEKLNAQIKLHLAGENPSDISVRLAAPEKFDQAGVPWSYSLSKLKFDPVVKADGSMMIKVSTRDAYVEPFLNFLLEVSWPQGSLVREFTLLIDPPSEYITPSLAVADNRVYQAESDDSYAQRPVKKRKTARVSVNNSPSVGNITPLTPASGEVGPVRAQDTLWNIAASLSDKQGVSTQQMMTALFRANPDAFIHGDMDLLKAGVVLKVPEITPNNQLSSVQKPNSSKTTTSKVKSLELVAPGESSIPENAEPTSGGKSPKEITTPNAGDGRGIGKDLELQVRIEKLQEQLNMMQQLLILKDQQLSALQNKDKEVAATNSAAVSSTVIPTAKSLQPVTPLPEAGHSQLPVVPQPVASIAPTAKPNLAITVTAKPVVPAVKPSSTTEENTSAYYVGVGGITVGIFALIGGLWWRKRKIEERTNSESMFASASQIKMPDSDSALSVPVVDINNAASYDVGTVGESSFISDFTPSDFDAFDTDQNDVDPLSEADVYLAYGRYQQAEDLIRHAIKDTPDRDDYKLKLLEILYANENRDAFAIYAQELSASGKQEDRVFWTKVTDMGKEILPGHVLFGGSTDTTSTIANFDVNTAKKTAEIVQDVDSSFGSTDDLLDLDDAGLPDLELMNDINSELAELQLDSDRPGLADESSLDFDLSNFSSATVSTPIDKANQIETIDFDLSGLSAVSKDNPSTNPFSSESDRLSNFDFDFDSGLSDQDASLTKTHSNDELPLDMTSLESFEFPDFIASADKQAGVIAAEDKTVPVVGSQKASDTENFDFSFDFDAPGVENSVEEDDDLGVFDLTDMDEFETKIDLAKAYIDMGDTEMAKKIAKEVLEKGSKEQQHAAQAILDEL